MPTSMRNIHRIIKRHINKNVTVQKRYPIISLLDVATNTTSSFIIINANNAVAQPADLSQVSIPFPSVVKAVHLDLTIIKSGLTSGEDNAVWMLYKDPGGQFGTQDGSVPQVGLGPYIIARGAVLRVVNAVTAIGEVPQVPYHLSGWFMLRRHSKFLQGDILRISLKSSAAGSNWSMFGSAVFKYRT